MFATNQNIKRLRRYKASRKNINILRIMSSIMANTSYVLLNQGELILATRYAHIYWVEENQTIVCQTITDYIPHQEFQIIFQDILEYAQYNPTKMFVFDKSSLVTFHQDAIRFFYFDWKPEMNKIGVNKFKHILPKNNTFRISLKTTKDILRKEKPEICLGVPCVEYIENIDEAFEF